MEENKIKEIEGEDLERLEFYFFKDLSYLKEKIKGEEILKISSSICKVIEIIDDKSIIITFNDFYKNYKISQVSKKLKLNHYYFNKFGVFVEIDEKIINKENIEKIEYISYNYFEKMEKEGIVINSIVMINKIMKEEKRIEKENLRKEKIIEKEMREKKMKEKREKWEKEGFYGREYSFKIEKNLLISGDIKFSIDKNFNEFLKIKDVDSLIGENTNLIQEILNKIKVDIKGTFDCIDKKIEIEIKDGKVYMDKVKVRKSKIAFILNRLMNDLIKDKKDIENYNKFTDEQVEALKKKEISLYWCDGEYLHMPCEIKCIKKNKWKFKLLNWEKESEWGILKKLIESHDWTSYQNFFSIPKQEFLDESKKIKLLSNLKNE